MQRYVRPVTPAEVWARNLVHRFRAVLAGLVRPHQDGRAMNARLASARRPEVGVRRILGLVLLAGLAVAGCGGGDSDPGVTIRSLSTHAEHVSGGDVLLEIEVVSAGTAPEVRVGGADVTEPSARTWIGPAAGPGS